MAVTSWLHCTSLLLIFVGIHLSSTNGTECRPWSFDGMERAADVSFFDSCYMFSTTALTWSEAREFCRNNGGDLAVSSSIYEDTIYSGRPGCWFIGLTKDSASNWKWIDDWWFTGGPKEYSTSRWKPPIIPR